jgi:hypothetical protein
MLDTIWNFTLTIVKFAFGAGGVIVFVGKNLVLAGAAIYWHHDTLGEAVCAVSPFGVMLVGDFVWWAALILLRKHAPAAESLGASMRLWRMRLLRAPKPLNYFGVATTGNA